MWSWIINKINSLKPLSFLSKALSEQDGTPSTSRLTAFLTTFAVIGWVTFVVIHTGALPDLTSASLFVAGGHGGYAANKLSEVLGAKNASPTSGTGD